MSDESLSIRAPDEVWEDAEEGVEGLLDDWFVGVDDPVKAGDVIASLMVVKTSFDLEAPASGTIRGILVAKGETFARGSELATIRPSA